MKKPVVVLIAIFTLALSSCYKVVFNTVSPEIKEVQVFDENNASLENLEFEVVLDGKKLDDVKIYSETIYTDDAGKIIPTYLLVSKTYGKLLTWETYTIAEADEKTFITVSKAGYKSMTFKKGSYSEYLIKIVLEEE